MAERVYNWEDLRELPVPGTFNNTPLSEAQDAWCKDVQEHLRQNRQLGAWVLAVGRVVPFEQEISVLVTPETDLSHPDVAALFPDEIDGEQVVYIKMHAPEPLGTEQS